MSIPKLYPSSPKTLNPEVQMFLPLGEEDCFDILRKAMPTPTPQVPKHEIAQELKNEKSHKEVAFAVKIALTCILESYTTAWEGILFRPVY